MKKGIALFLPLLMATLIFGQDKTKMRVIILKPKADMIGEFEKGLAAHVAKFHAQATDPVTVYEVASGKHTGEYHFIQGPSSWADMEGKVYAGDHSDDWNKSVGKFLQSSETHYLTYQPDFSYNPNQGAADWTVVTFITLNPNSTGTYESMMKTRKDALTKAKDGRNYQVFSHSFSGRDDEFSYAVAADLKGGLKELDTDLTPLAKVLGDQVGPYAQQQWAYDADKVLKKVESMLVHRMAALSSK